MVDEWRPSLVALDIDGTLLIPDFVAGHSAEQTTQPVAEAVLAAARAGAHVVLASGRAPLSMAGVADRLDLTRTVEELTGERLHVVASNGSVVTSGGSAPTSGANARAGGMSTSIVPSASSIGLPGLSAAWNASRTFTIDARAFFTRSAAAAASPETFVPPPPPCLPHATSTASPRIQDRIRASCHEEVRRPDSFSTAAPASRWRPALLHRAS